MDQKDVCPLQILSMGYNTHTSVVELLVTRINQQMHFIYMIKTDQQLLMTIMLMVLVSHTDSLHDNTFGHLLLHYMKQNQLVKFVPVLIQTSPTQ